MIPRIQILNNIQRKREYEMPKEIIGYNQRYFLISCPTRKLLIVGPQITDQKRLLGLLSNDRKLL